ncbi:MAG: heme exporter protein CcmB [Bdellovibrionales bacterium]|nr:heme exporter protein CcmB [Bdellovibrionales bacterium]
MKQLWILFQKELRYECRSLQTIVALLSLSLLLSTVVALGLSGAFLPPNTTAKIFPSLIWMVFLFASTIAVGRVFEPETRDGALNGLILSGVPLWKVFTAKCLFLWVLISLVQIFTVLLLSLILNVAIATVFPSLLLLSCLVSFGYASLALLLAAISSTSRLKGILLPLLLLPLLFPLFFTAIELTIELFVGHTGMTESFWFTFLLGVDVLYYLVAINLFDHVVEG